jgi:hypothetical protein
VPKTTPTSEIRRDVLIPLSALTAHPRNYRKHPKKQVARIRASLRREGVVRFRGREYREPVRDAAWKLAHLWHNGTGRMRV